MALDTQQRLKAAVEDCQARDAQEQAVKALKSTPLVDALALRMYAKEGGLTFCRYATGAAYTPCL